MSNQQIGPEPRVVRVDFSVPTSRSNFRPIAKSFGATNREADALRSWLLAQWASAEGTYELEMQLRELRPAAPSEGVPADNLLVVWFSTASASLDDGTLPDLPDALRSSLLSCLETNDATHPTSGQSEQDFGGCASI